MTDSAVPTRRVLVPVLAAVVLLSGCSSIIEGTPVAATAGGATQVTGGECESLPGRMTQIDAHSPGEPTLILPQPDGWERTTGMDSELIRFVMVNRGLANNGYAPTAVLTLESGPSSDSPDAILDQQAVTLESQLGATDVAGVPGVHCGFPAQTIGFRAPSLGGIPPRYAKVLCVVVEGGPRTYLTTLTVQTAEPDNPTYIHDLDTILRGFQVVAR